MVTPASQVSYALTPLGHSLTPILRALKDWVRVHDLQVAALQPASELSPSAADAEASVGRDSSRLG